MLSQPPAATQQSPLPLSHIAILTSLIALSAAVRFGVADHSLWFDEQASAFYSDQPLARLWSDWMLRETNPPLYYSSLRGWRWIFGSSDFAIRSMSVVCSLVALLAVYELTAKTFSRFAGLTAAALAAASAQHLYYAEQARAYIFELCALTIAINALVTLTAGHENRRKLARAGAIYAIAATTAIYLHTTAILFPIIALIAVFAADPNRIIARPLCLTPLVLANSVVFIVASWEIRQAILQLLHSSDNISAIGLVGPIDIARQSIRTLFLAGSGKLMSALLAGLMVAMTLIFVIKDRYRYETRLLVSLGATAFIFFAIIGMVAPVFVPRTIFWISLVPTILTAAAIADIKLVVVRRAVLGVLLALLSIDATQLMGSLEQEDWNTPVVRIVRYPEAVLLVQGEAMAVLADHVCRRKLKKSDCPYQVIAITDPTDRYDTWATNLFDGTIIATKALRTIPQGVPLFMFRKNFGHDLPRLLHSHGFGTGVPVNGPPLLEPLMRR